VSEPAWLRQPFLRCEYCGEPGHLIAIAEPVSAVYSTDPAEMLKPMPLETHITCPEHRFLVENRALRVKDEERFAERDHGRPVLDAETHPDRMRRAISTLVRRLGGWNGPEDGR